MEFYIAIITFGSIYYCFSIPIKYHVVVEQVCCAVVYWFENVYFIRFVVS